jgi:hypothetical protein
MKQKILIAAGMLCLGTSPAFAFTIPAMAPDMAKAVKDVWMDEAKTPKAQSAGAEAFDPALPVTPADAVTKTAALGDPDLDLSVKPEGALVKSGPSEAVMQTMSTPAAAAYPPCRRGAGDDHCIQLYEPGVRAQLAGWNRSARGSDSAMGGPYEPVDTTLAGEMGGSDTTPIAMNGDGVTDPAMGETMDAGVPSAK